MIYKIFLEQKTEGFYMKFRCMFLLSLLTMISFPFIVPAQPKEFPEIAVRKIELEGEWRFRPDPDGEGMKLGLHKKSPQGSKWKDIQVPGNWERQIPSAATYDGDAWYAKSVVIPQEWKDLDVYMDLGKVDDAALCFYNGEKIGESRHIEEGNRFLIPSGLIEYGKDNLISVRVRDFGGTGGIYPGPVFIRPEFPWDRFVIELDDSGKDYIFRTENPVEFDVRIENPFEKYVFLNVYIEVKNIYGESVFRKALPIKIPGKKAARTDVAPARLPVSWYEATVKVGDKNQVFREEQFPFVVLGEAIEFKDVESSPFGLCGGALFHIPLETHKTTGRIRMNQMNQLGIRWGRNSVWWDAIYQKQEEYEWEKADSVVKYYEDYDINMLAILNSSTDPLLGRPPVTEKGREAWGEYVRALVNR